MTQITDSDREAAADIWRDYVARVGEIIVEKQMRQGGLDYGLPTRLAEHRVQSTTAMAAEIVRLKAEAFYEGLERAWDLARGTNADLCKTPDAAYRTIVQRLRDECNKARTYLGQQEQRT